MSNSDLVNGEPTSVSRRRALIGSLFGNILEWYDFFLYGTAAAIVFNELFFPQFDPLVGTIAAFGSYAAGFAARPIGGVLFSHFGDRVGRRPILMATLLIMGLATFCMGLLPTYEQVGVLAPILLVTLRITQGVATGGEWGGASLLMSEYALPRNRGLYSGITQSGISVGFLLSTLLLQLVSYLPEAQFVSWGWRLPFLISILVAAFGLVIRYRVAETPAFRPIKESRSQHKFPFLRVLRSEPRSIIITLGLRLAENSSSYVIATFGVTYATEFLAIDITTVLTGLTIATAIQIPMMVGYGALSDKIGRKGVYISGVVMLIVVAFPFFMLLETGNTVLIWVAMILGFAIVYSAMAATQACFFAELFESRARFSGVAIGHEFGAVMAGGLSPLIATTLLYFFNSSWPVSIYLIALGGITLAALILAPETRHKPLYGKEGEDESVGVA